MSDDAALSHNSSARFEQQIGIESLVPLVNALVPILGHKGIGGGALGDLLQARVSVTCLSCDISLNGLDVSEIAFGPSDSASRNSKLERVRLGFCARNSCQGRYYLLRLDEHPEIDWFQIWMQLQTQLDLQGNGISLQQIGKTLFANQPVAKQKRQRYYIMIGIGAALLLIWWVKNGLYFPGISAKPRVFIVAPP